MVNRGTSDFKDVMTDAKLLFGYKDKSRFGEAKDVLNKVKQKYTDKNIDVLGHSLGATVAEALGDDPRIKNIIN
jgi:putative lipase involved disintegration of autophagic bodies